MSRSPRSIRVLAHACTVEAIKELRRSSGAEMDLAQLNAGDRWIRERDLSYRAGVLVLHSRRCRPVALCEQERSSCW